jgi:branched-chain amino acid transport system permease protein
MENQTVQTSQSASTNWIAAAVVTALLFMLPFVLAKLGKPGEYWIGLTTQMLVYALFAMSLNLILGFGGMVSFGHAAFFGVGAYTVALLMKKAGMPLYVALAVAPITGAIAAAIIGWFCVRLIGLYFAILTLAFSQLLFMVAFQWRDLTGGDDGIHGIPRPDRLADPVNYYLFCLIIFLLCFLLMRMIVNSSFGLSIRTIRENMERAKFIGINVRRYQWMNFVIAGAFAGLAGGLLAQLDHFAHPGALHWSKSADPILGSLVGGMYSLVGPAIGSTVLILLHHVLQLLHSSMVEMWEIVLGVVLLFVVLFAPGGLVGICNLVLGRTES